MVASALLLLMLRVYFVVVVDAACLLRSWWLVVSHYLQVCKSLHALKGDVNKIHVQVLVVPSRVDDT